jgi:hypothetical protein
MELYYNNISDGKRTYLRNVKAKNRIELASQMGINFYGYDNELYYMSNVYATNIFSFKGFEFLFWAIVWALPFVFAPTGYIIVACVSGAIFGEWHRQEEQIKVDMFNHSKFKILQS